ARLASGRQAVAAVDFLARFRDLERGRISEAAHARVRDVFRLVAEQLAALRIVERHTLADYLPVEAGVAADAIGVRRIARSDDHAPFRGCDERGRAVEPTGLHDERLSEERADGGAGDAGNRGLQRLDAHARVELHDVRYRLFLGAARRTAGAAAFK